MQQEMRYIWEIYRSGNFSKAAEKLYLTQPALSLAVRRVEKELGFTIFDRSYQPLKLTEAGQIYLRHIMEIRRSEEDLRRELDDFSASGGEMLRLGGTQYFNAYLLPPVLKNILQDTPRLRLSIEEENSMTLNKLLLDGEVDVICHSGSFDKKLCEAVPLISDNLLIAVAEDFQLPDELKKISLSGSDVINGLHLDEKRKIADVSVFAGLPFLFLSETNHLRERTLAICEAGGLDPKICLEVKQLETAWHMILNGLGLAFVTDYMARANPAAPLRYFPLESARATRTFCAIFRKKSYISKAMKRFTELFGRNAS